MSKKEKIILLLLLNHETINTIGNLFNYVEKIHGHKKSFLCLPRKAQWRSFFQGEQKDETEFRWDKAHAIMIFDVNPEEKILSELTKIEGVSLYRGENIEKKLEIISDWNVSSL